MHFTVVADSALNILYGITTTDYFHYGSISWLFSQLINLIVQFVKNQKSETNNSNTDE